MAKLVWRLCGLLLLIRGQALAQETCQLDDGLALHQKVLRLRSVAQESEAAPELTTPSKSETAKVRPQLREVTDGIFRRATAKLKLPAIPAVFRWELVGKATAWAVKRYQEPKTQASLELLDDIIDLAAEVLGSKDIATMEDREFAARLGNITRLHHMAQHYVDLAGAPPAVRKFVDTAAEAVKSKGSLEPSAAAQMLIDVANETSGPALANLLSYMKRVSEGKEHFDAATSIELHAPVLAQFGLPHEITQYMHTLAEKERSHLPRNEVEDATMVHIVLAAAARELGMPEAISEMFEYLAGVISPLHNVSDILKPETMAKVAAHLSDLDAKLVEQLGAPASATELVRRAGAPLRNETALDSAELLGLLSRVSKEVPLPGAVAEFFDYLAPFAAKKGGAPDPEHLQELLLKLSEQLGAPEAFAKFGKDAAALGKSGAGAPDPAKLAKLVSQLFKKLGLPAFADIFAKLGAPLLKGKQPDPLALAAVAPSMMKVLPDFEAANGLAKDMRTKLMKPLLPFYETAVERLTGKMPESGLKALFKQVLSVARPQA